MNASIPRGLTADDIAHIWKISLGSIYRLASQRKWRRYRDGGRTYYHARDVTETLDSLTP
jgi:hypothetical protein